MADNYLEKMMDDLRSGKISPTFGVRKCVLQKTNKPNKGVHTILIGISDENLLKGREMRKSGATVDLVSDDYKRGNEISQRESFRFWPVESMDISGINKRLEEIGAYRKIPDMLQFDSTVISDLIIYRKCNNTDSQSV